MKTSPTWVTGLSAVLAGWLVLLFSSFVLLVALSSLASRAGINIVFGSTPFILEVVVVIGIAALLAFVVARRCYKWAGKSSAQIVYGLLIVLLVITVLSFPAIFTYGMVAE